MCEGAGFELWALGVEGLDRGWSSTQDQGPQV